MKNLTKKVAAFFVILLLIFMLFSCTYVEFSSKDGKLAYGPNIRKYEVVGSFSITIT